MRRFATLNKQSISKKEKVLVKNNCKKEKQAINGMKIKKEERKNRSLFFIFKRKSIFKQ